MLQSDWFPSSHESTSSFISHARLLFSLYPMLGVGVSVPCICSVSGLMLQSDWFPSSHEISSSLILLAGGGCSTGENSRF
ncbi:hypothetical protein XELAEV_18002326mg, partial [Xenopus laevis]